MVLMLLRARVQMEQTAIYLPQMVWRQIYALAVHVEHDILAFEDEHHQCSIRQTKNHAVVSNPGLALAGAKTGPMLPSKRPFMTNLCMARLEVYQATVVVEHVVISLPVT